MSLICSALHCDTHLFIDSEVRNKDLLISTMNRGTDTEKSKKVKARIQDYMNDFAFINEIHDYHSDFSIQKSKQDFEKSKQEQPEFDIDRL